MLRKLLIGVVAASSLAASAAIAYSVRDNQAQEEEWHMTHKVMECGRYTVTVEGNITDAINFARESCPTDYRILANQDYNR